MLDIQYIRDNCESVETKAKQKGFAVDIAKLLEIDEKRRHLIGQADEIRKNLNEASKEFKSKPPNEIEREELRSQKQMLNNIEHEQQMCDDLFWQLLKAVPNMPLEDVPIGTSEDDNQVVKTVGEPIDYDFTPKSHWELSEQKDLIDKERAAKVAGSRFAYLKGQLVMLEFALWQFALQQLTNEQILEKIISENNLDLSAKPFTPILPPAVAKTDVYEATGRLDKEQQTYKLADDDLWLNASAEHTLAPMYMDEILAEKDLPIRFVGFTTAFRREAGTYGKDMEGIFRLHQFNKLEMESFSLASSSLQEHYFMIAIQEYLMQQLGLPYQVILKCTADIGKPNARGVDINAWFPSQQRYRETHTADYITDYQARRMRTRVRLHDGTIDFVHTNDATVFSERPLIAILENFQTEDGNIIIPDVLRPFMQGRSEI